MPPAERFGVLIPCGGVRAPGAHDPARARNREIRRLRRHAVRRVAHTDAIAHPHAVGQRRRHGPLGVQDEPPRRQGRVDRGGAGAHVHHAAGDLHVAPHRIRHVVDNDRGARPRRARGQAPPGRIRDQCVLRELRRPPVQVIECQHAAVGQPHRAVARPHTGHDAERAVRPPQQRLASRFAGLDEDLAVGGREADHVRRLAEERAVDGCDNVRFRITVIPRHDLACPFPAGAVAAAFRPADSQAVLRPGAVHGDDEHPNRAGQRVLDVFDALGDRAAVGDLGRGAVRREAGHEENEGGTQYGSGREFIRRARRHVGHCDAAAGRSPK